MILQYTLCPMPIAEHTINTHVSYIFYTLWQKTPWELRALLLFFPFQGRKKQYSVLYGGSTRLIDVSAIPCIVRIICIKGISVSKVISKIQLLDVFFTYSWLLQKIAQLTVVNVK